MKIILSVDAVKPPLTGIGRYAWELARRLPAQSGVEQVRYFFHGKWVDELDGLLTPPALMSAARRGLASSDLARTAYRLISPCLLNARLRPYSGHLYHSPNYYVPPFGGIALATVHDLSIYKLADCHPPERVRYMEREIPKAIDRAFRLLTSSEYTRREVIDFFGLPEERVMAVPLGVGEEFRPRGEEELRAVLGKHGLDHCGYSLFVSTIEPRKNLGSLLTAYERLPRELRSRYPLLCVGDRGWHSEATHERLVEAQRQGWARYLGYVPEAELPLLYSGARAFLYPSLYEGFGLPLLEAMASGVPALTSNRTSLPEVAAGAALVVEPDDIGALTEGIRKVLEDEPWRDQASARGLARAGELGWDNTARRTTEIYRTLQ